VKEKNKKSIEEN